MRTVLLEVVLRGDARGHVCWTKQHLSPTTGRPVGLPWPKKKVELFSRFKILNDSLVRGAIHTT